MLETEVTINDEEITHSITLHDNAGYYGNINIELAEQVEMNTGDVLVITIELEGDS